MVLGVSDLNYGYGNYGGFRTNFGYQPKDAIYRPVFGGNFQPYNAPKKSEKVGFWEGTKAFFKGLIKPIKNLIKHPIKSALFIAGTAALIIGTGGAATPFLIAAGIGLGGFQVAKGAYKAITSNTRQETLSGLEDMGEGTFTLGASVAGAKSYASSTSAGSATAAAAKETTLTGKLAAYSKGLYQDTATVIKAAPESAKTTLAMVRSGEFTGNINSYLTSAKLAAEHRQVAEMRLNKDPNYTAAYKAYKEHLAAYNKAMSTRQEAVFNKYVDMANNNNSPVIQNNALRLIDNNFRTVPNYRALRNNMNIFRNLPEENLAIGIGSPYLNDEAELEETINTYGPAFGLTT